MAITPYKVSIGKSRISGDSAEAYLGRQSREDFANILANMRGFINHMSEGVAEVLAEALEPTLELSWEYVPVDSGDLLRSSYLEVEKFRGQSRCEIGYAKGGNPSYAIYVHEMPRWHEPPTSYKFLERAIMEDWDNIQGRVISGLKELSGT